MEGGEELRESLQMQDGKDRAAPVGSNKAADGSKGVILISLMAQRGAIGVWMLDRTDWFRGIR